MYYCNWQKIVKSIIVTCLSIASHFSWAQDKVECLSMSGIVIEKPNTSHIVKRVNCPGYISAERIVAIENHSSLSIKIPTSWNKFTGLTQQIETIKINGPTVFRLNKDSIRDIVFNEHYRRKVDKIRPEGSDPFLELTDAFNRTLSLLLEPVQSLRFDESTGENLPVTAASLNCEVYSPYDKERLFAPDLPVMIAIEWKCATKEILSLNLWNDDSSNQKQRIPVKTNTSYVNFTRDGVYNMQFLGEKGKKSKVFQFEIHSTYPKIVGHAKARIVSPLPNFTFTNTDHVEVTTDLSLESKSKKRFFLIAQHNDKLYRRFDLDNVSKTTKIQVKIGTYQLRLLNEKDETLDVVSFSVKRQNLGLALRKFLKAENNGSIVFQQR